MKYANATKVNRKSGERSGGTCCSSSTASNLNGNAILPFVIPTEAKRSGGICSAPLRLPKSSLTNLNTKTAPFSRSANTFSQPWKYHHSVTICLLPLCGVLLTNPMAPVIPAPGPEGVPYG
jgi:hypothetical protein